jgi:hypothetical protein
MNSGFSYLTQTQENKWIFYAAGNSWQVWQKPDGCNFIHIVVIGAGAGGGKGNLKITGANGGGGGGGAAGGISRTMLPAYALPDKLHIRVGAGGVGGTGGTVTGTPPSTSYIALIPDAATTSANILISIAATGLSCAGGGGTATAGTLGNSGGFTLSTPFSGWGKYAIIPAQNGFPGSINTSAFDTGRIVTGGAGGCGTQTANVSGRDITSSFKQPSSVIYSKGAAVNTTTKSSNGSSFLSPQPQFFGGAGGAGGNTITGSNGGDGGIGCGGGGGGAGITTATDGGRGGDGMVIITCW